MGLGLILAVGLPVVALTILAIVTTVKLTTLRLPIPTTIQILTTLLPLLGGLNTLYRPRRPTPAQTLIFNTLQSLQGLLVAILGTFFFERIPSSSSSSGGLPKCLLTRTWDTFWRSKDAGAIRAIQDQLNCCGFNSVKDRAWPFPEGKQPDYGACARQFHRTVACSGVWGQKLSLQAGLGLVVVVGVGVLQAAYLIYGQPNTWSGDWSWRAALKLIGGEHGRRNGAGAGNRRLLMDADGEETRVEPYHDEPDEPEAHDDVQENQGPPQLEHRQDEDGHNGGPRVEPAGLGHHESNEWRSV